MRSAMWLLVALLFTAAVLAAGKAQAMPPRLGWELSVAPSSFAYVDEWEPFQDKGRWLPRMAVLTRFEIPGRARISPMIEYVERGVARTATQPFFSEEQTIHEAYLALGLQSSRPLFSR